MKLNGLSRRTRRSARRPGRYGQAYVALIVLLGAAAIVDAGARLLQQPTAPSWLVLAVLTWIVGAFAVRVPQVPASVSVSETFVYMILLLFGGPPATLTVAVDGLLTSVVRRDRQMRRLLFNLSEPALSTWVAWQTFAWLAGTPPLIAAPATLSALVLPMLAMTSVYFAMNSGLTALAVATDTGRPPFQIWRTHFAGVALNYFAAASVALLVALNTHDVSWSSFGAAAPVVLLLYVAFNTRTRRSEDADRHLAELNRLYLSTVQSLALAIDAKDQVTHGHIRRVQRQALELGRRLGIRAGSESKALEAAALLHDIGKLAVPDYILNKPGRLTEPEYERVKQHAVVGADILSAVEFPYPVVPIVRHHHENWDGSGYPDRLAGEAIPLGARILAVVDCYDALTSDRPYRRALSATDAIAIISSRRGFEYDPRVVDAFLELQPSLDVPDEEGMASANLALDRVTRSVDCEPGAWPAARPAFDAAKPVFEAWSLVRAHGELATTDLLELLARRVRRLTPASLVVIYRADAVAQELRVAHASGSGDACVSDLRIAFGRGTSGWVAANVTPVMNGDPGLDAGTRLDDVAPRLECGAAVPLVSGGTVVGVLACYAPGIDAFDERHRDVLDGLSAVIAPALDRTGESGTRGAPRSFGVLVAHARPRIREPREAAAFELQDAVEAAARRIVRASDLVVHGGDGEIVVLLASVDPESGRDIGDRLRFELEAWTGTLSLAIGLAIAPHDGASLEGLVAAARQRAAASAGRGSDATDAVGVKVSA